MLTNYFKVALRNLRKRKGYAFINVAGLAVGMACCLLIALYVRDERSYDRYHDHADRIVRLVEDRARVGAPFGPALLGEFPEVEQVARLHPMFWTTPLLRAGEQGFYEDRIFFADSSLFDVFSFRLLRGDPKTALAAPFSMVLTEAMAEKYFGDVDPMGQIISYDNTHNYTVTGVVENTPPNSHFRFDFLASFSTLYVLEEFWGMPLTWTNPTAHTYLLLTDPGAASTLEARLPDFIVKHRGEAFRDGRTFRLQPLTNIHLASRLRFEIEPNSDGAYLYIFSAIGLAVLLIACFNFINLATARSAERAREVGMRKVVGAHRRQLVGQFLSESMVLSLVAGLLALGLVALSLPAFNALSGKALTMSAVAEGAMLLGLVAVVLFVGIVAGSYPAFVLARFRPVAVLKGASTTTSGGVWLRKGLVLAQFALSVMLIVGAATVYDQLDFMRSSKLGFDDEQILVAPLLDRSLRPQVEALQRELLRHPNVVTVSGSHRVPGQLFNGFGYVPEGGAPENPVGVRDVGVDHDFTKTYGLDVAAGRDWSRAIVTDEDEAFMLNETAARAFGWADPNDAVGKRLTRSGQEGVVIGVVKDFHFQSLHHAIEPLLMHLRPFVMNVSIRVRTDDLPATVASLERTWKQFSPAFPFDYYFFDETFDSRYRAEERAGQLFGYFALLAVFIACLGLFGLAAFSASQRTREIGVRKVLGASVSGIVVLLSKDFVTLVGWAFVVATPVAYLAMNRWLAGFPYHVEISWRIFLVAGLAALVIAVLTVSYQSIRAALADPVKALRYE